MGQAPMLVAEGGARPDHVRRAGQRREIAGARHVVVVEVGLDDARDPDAKASRGVEVEVDVAPRDP